jgi:hypothetical protein
MLWGAIERKDPRRFDWCFHSVAIFEDELEHVTCKGK